MTELPVGVAEATTRAEVYIRPLRCATEPAVVLSGAVRGKRQELDGGRGLRIICCVPEEHGPSLAAGGVGIGAS